MLLTVTVPDGLFAGDVMSVEHAGLTYEIEVPSGCSGGMPIEIDLPGGEDEQQQPAGTQPVEVVVPDGVFEGGAFPSILVALCTRSFVRKDAVLAVLLLWSCQRLCLCLRLRLTSTALISTLTAAHLRGSFAKPPRHTF